MEALDKIKKILDKWRLDNLGGIPSYDTVVGSSKTFIYYADAGGGKNPSGNTENLQYITYIRDGVTAFYQEFSYDGVDNVIKQEVKAGSPV